MSPIAQPLEAYWRRLSAVLPEFSPGQQRAAVTLYRELAKGDPVAPGRFARALGASEIAARGMLESPPLHALTYYDDDGRIVGFGGLATAPMHHRFAVDGRDLWTWCAWDALFIPEILGVSARVESVDPESGEAVRLTVSPHGIESRSPEEVVVSFPVPDDSRFDDSAANVMATFCHFVYFFSSEATAERWLEAHDSSVVYSLDEAFELARRLNNRNFGVELGRRGSAA